jgi:hypothetical protein
MENISNTTDSLHQMMRCEEQTFQCQCGEADDEPTEIIMDGFHMSVSEEQLNCFTQHTTSSAPKTGSLSKDRHFFGHKAKKNDLRSYMYRYCHLGSGLNRHEIDFMKLELSVDSHCRGLICLLDICGWYYNHKGEEVQRDADGPFYASPGLMNFLKSLSSKTAPISSLLPSVVIPVIERFFVHAHRGTGFRHLDYESSELLHKFAPIVYATYQYVLTKNLRKWPVS